MAALDAGFTHFDVAPAYGDGLAESELGRVLVPKQRDFSIGTKFGIPTNGWGAKSAVAFYTRAGLSKAALPRLSTDFSQRDFSPDHAVRSLEHSLRRLRVDHVDYLLLHEPRGVSDVTTLPSLVEVLEKQKRLGKLLHYGIAAPTAVLSDLHMQGITFGDTLQFGLSEASPQLIRETGCSNRFAYGLIHHLSPQRHRPRLNLADAIEWFKSFVPNVVPIISTTRVEQLEALGSTFRK
jgi:aryl-alcohol dehydrogenase-like predicted oxidoreductase